MNYYILLLKKWYEQREIRERLLLLILSWTLLYAFVHFFFFKPQETEQTKIENEIKALHEHAKDWNVQIVALKNISASPLYQQWLTQYQSFQRMQGKYKHILEVSSANQWENVIKDALTTEQNITIVQMRNFPEELYTPNTLSGIKQKIYQQRFALVFYSNYLNTIQYLIHLEKILPNIRWISLRYQVAQYPLAKVDMEFAILYEKTT